MMADGRGDQNYTSDPPGRTYHRLPAMSECGTMNNHES